MVTQSHDRAKFIALQTVPGILKNGDRTLEINTLLDDASTKSYINADVADKLDLQGRNKKLTVNVLNGQAETFKTRPVNVRLKSTTGNISMIVSTYTIDRVTGNMPVVDWNKLKTQLTHLQNIDFPSSPSTQVLDMLIGLDCADLLYAMHEMRGRPGEPRSDFGKSWMFRYHIKFYHFQMTMAFEHLFHVNFLHRLNEQLNTCQQQVPLDTRLK